MGWLQHVMTCYDTPRPGLDEALPFLDPLG